MKVFCESAPRRVSYRVPVIGTDNLFSARPPSTLDHGSASPGPGIKEIAPRFAGMELTDAVHWGLIFGRNGKLTPVENGSVSKNTGTWQVTKDKLCLINTPA